MPKKPRLPFQDGSLDAHFVLCALRGAPASRSISALRRVAFGAKAEAPPAFMVVVNPDGTTSCSIFNGFVGTF